MITAINPQTIRTKVHDVDGKSLSLPIFHQGYLRVKIQQQRKTKCGWVNQMRLLRSQDCVK